MVLVRRIDNRRAMNRPISFKPDFSTRDPGAPLVRAVLATARARSDALAAAKLARTMWSDDKVTPALIQRATTNPADTVTSGWASDVGTFALADFVATMGGAASTLLTRALQVSFDGSAV